MKILLRCFVLSLLVFAIMGFLFYSVLLYIINKEKLEYLPEEIQSFEVVVARYNEDLSWIAKEFPREKVIVYNKGKDDLSLGENCTIVKLPNIGRESHTYLYHIVHNYNKLAQRTLFLQGSQESEKRWVFFPLKRYKIIAKTNCENIIAAHCFILNEKRSNIHLSEFVNSKWHNTVMREYNFSGFKHQFIDIGKNNDVFFFSNFGANFAVDIDKIYRNNIEYYQRILATLDNIAPVEGHYLEKLWNLMFAPNKSLSSQ